VKPGGGSPQSLNVRILTPRRMALVALERRRPDPAWARTPRNSRSMVEALTASRRLLTALSSMRWPCRSIAGTRTGSAAFRRLPQTRSEASQSTSSAARTAAP
jgi:hypothetical protein